MKYKKQIFASILVLFVLSILFFDATSEQEITNTDEQFNNWIFSVIDEAKADSSYKRIPLESKADQRWFLELTYKAWDHEISHKKYVKIGTEKFPNYKESFLFIASRLPK